MQRKLLPLAALVALVMLVLFSGVAAAETIDTTQLSSIIDAIETFLDTIENIFEFETTNNI